MRSGAELIHKSSNNSGTLYQIENYVGLRIESIVFATNARARSKQDLISKIPDEYKKRWEIETGYACMERIRPRTSSRNDSIRMLLMYLPLVIYNAWIMENYAAGACADGGRPVITLRRLMSRFILIIAVSVLSSRYSHYLEFVG